VVDRLPGAAGDRRGAADPVDDGVLVLNSFPPEERGKGLAVFFIVAGLFTAIGPIAGSYLTQYWTWRAIFWINIPVALLSLTEFAFVKLKDVKHPARIDWGGAILLVAGMGLTVLGLQESNAWGLGQPGDDRLDRGRARDPGSFRAV
jgi:MFS family permease